jgi:uncharacterized membrane protein
LLDNLLLLLGSILLLDGIVFFFAYNWNDMTRFQKFGILELGVLMMAMVALWRGLEKHTGKVALLAMAILLGALLAVYGQTYQTGADAFGLFLAWAALITPWVIIGTFAPLWFLLTLLLNLSLIFYWEQIIYPTDFQQYLILLLLLFLLNGMAMIVWELAYRQGIAWLRNGRWLGQILFLLTLTTVIIPTVEIIVRPFNLEYHLSIVAVVLYIGLTIWGLWHYRSQRRDLPLLTACLLGILIVVTTLIAQILPLAEPESWLIISLAVIGQATWAKEWLTQVLSDS